MTDTWTGSAYDTRSDAQLSWGAGVVEALDIAPDSAVLDAGCGSGRVTEELLRRFPAASVTAVDFSASMLAQARTRLGAWQDRTVLERVDLEQPLPFADSAFDVVFSTGALHWVRDHAAFFAEAARVLRPGGQLAIQCGGHRSLAQVHGILADLGIDSAARNLYATAEDTADRLTASGFTGVRTWLVDAPVAFETREEAADFLDAAALGPYLADRSEADRRSVVRTVAARLPSPVLDFVRLNMTARLPSASQV
ncbi:class I SAM-dependent methyltransferase [Yinghuangia soli]|uniref:Class I SAM-dependent methyltransferase n=1 Tax=Yinghuangia soli TaxID=2908204 RepID=A0AA41Q9V9_9ACTN|nr:class I SAM-dependent methyltransferase [Yinghuangia soli]MCF2532872.1 class I SAM-dependent methyltransferase [Yinghuangia soli]